MALEGRNIMIYRDGVLIAGTRSNDVESECEKKEVSSPAVGVWRRYKAGRKGWRVTVNYLVPAVANLDDLLKVGETYALEFRDRSGNGLGGQALCDFCKITATLGNLVQGSFQFTGDGELSELETE